MISKLCSLTEIEKLLNEGKSLLLAADEGLLKKVPKGNWIGGTIPYFMAAEGGLFSREKIFVTEIPSFVQGTEIQFYDDMSIEKIYLDAPDNGFTVLIIPANSETHFSFALNAPKYRDFATRPLVGWVSGVELKDLGKVSPKVFNGLTGEASDAKAISMRAKLPPEYACDIGIVNIFDQGGGDTLEFTENTFAAKDVLINGVRRRLSEYLVEKKIDLRLPLVANYGGANVNVCLRENDEKTGTVNFYGPVFKGIEYKIASPVSNYVQDFMKMVPKDSENVLFSCNCILNFLYSELEGKRTGPFVGPVTFGEIAYQLLNQTMVYLTVMKTEIAEN